MNFLKLTLDTIVEQIFFVLLALLITAPLVVIEMIIQKKKEKQNRLIAERYDIQYLPRIQLAQIDLMQDFRSRLFKYEMTVDIRNFFIGEYKDHQFNIFTLTFYVSKVSKFFRRNRKVFLVCSCEFGETEFPHILLKSKKMFLYQDSEIRERKVVLESEFLKEFDLFCPEKYEIEAMQIFTEKLLRSIKSISDDVSIELGGNRIYVYTNDKRGDIKKMLDLIKIIVNQTDGILFRLKDDFEVLDNFYKK